ncbi:uncharacterized protein [Halyomorpha halys]|uniref:uncharacterized protein n=1 Tax=Halyomorpha halys TaxID=286706 RepID=UPI0006D51963|nr:uncharacterized protein LOC106690208 [Halyomorpha halys]XP_014291042.1 uncharacterized protein LOC106690208 [Halyomorpha halys]
MSYYLSEHNKYGKRERQASGGKKRTKSSLDKAFHSILDGAADFLKTLIIDLAKSNETSAVNLGDYPAAITLEENCENPSKITFIHGLNANINSTNNEEGTELSEGADSEHQNHNEIDNNSSLVRLDDTEPNEDESKIKTKNTSGISDLRNIISEQLSKSDRLEKLRKFLVTESTNMFDDNNISQYPVEEVEYVTKVSVEEEEASEDPPILIIAEGDSDTRESENQEDISATGQSLQSEVESVKKRTQDIHKLVSLSPRKNLKDTNGNINKLIDCRLCWLMDCVKKCLDCDKIVQHGEEDQTVEERISDPTTEAALEDTKSKKNTEDIEGSSETFESSETTEETKEEEEKKEEATTEPISTAESVSEDTESDIDVTFKTIAIATAASTEEIKNNVTEEIDPDVYSPNIVHCDTTSLGFCDTSVMETSPKGFEKCTDTNNYGTYHCAHHCESKAPEPWSGCKIGIVPSKSTTQNPNTITIISDVEDTPQTTKRKIPKPSQKKVEIRMKRTTKKTVKYNRKTTRYRKKTTGVWEKEALQMVKKARQMMELQTIKIEDTVAPATKKILQPKTVALRRVTAKREKGKNYQPVTISLHIDFDNEEISEAPDLSDKLQLMDEDNLLSFVKNKKFASMKARRIGLPSDTKNKIKVLVQNGRVIGIIDKFGRLWPGNGWRRPM